VKGREARIAKIMQLGIIGGGAVGSATAMAARRARVREIVPVNRSRARAVATDMHYGVALSPMVSIRDGDYVDLADAGLAIIRRRQ
jgi:L-lactate dehydrogenase